MTEKEYYNALIALGCKDVTSKTQMENGTTAFRMPDGKNMVTEHRSGYIRRIMLSATGRVSHCYQLNPTYKVPYKVISFEGKLHEWHNNKRMFIFSRKERLKKLLSYITKKVQNEK
tara:strand:- start:393 stop:740 length:348 start_codon:yes stop_codon:yes gene_type:complete